jgi:cytochrome c-type biogenesis protein CcmF
VFQLQRVAGQNIELGVKESASIMQYVTLKAYKFPFINLVWLGTIIMVAGIFISMFYRREQGKRIATNLKVVRTQQERTGMLS